MELVMSDNKKNIIQSVNQYGKQLLSFIRGKVPSNEDAEDLLQEVWYQLSKVEEIGSIESMSGWLYSVARNKITDLFRKKKNDSIEDFVFESEDGVINFKDILLKETTNETDVFFKELFWDTLLKSLDELPENQRYVFIQNELEDRTLQEIADETGENLKTIISRKGYAIKHLRNRLNDLYQEIKN